MISLFSATRLRKAATDNGFDLEDGLIDGWAAYGSTKAPIKIWLTSEPNGHPVVALSQMNVARELAEYGAQGTASPPVGAAFVMGVPDYQALHRLLRRAFQLSRALPYGPLQRFTEIAEFLPRETEIERLVVQRLGQDIYRQGLIDYWQGRCAITELSVVEILRASHSKPWAQCEDDAERLDVFNGLLLAPHLDALFDKGLMTVMDDGEVVLSALLSYLARELLGLSKDMRVDRLSDSHRKYLHWHREGVFREA